jgi:hypothetical protein
VVVSNTDFTAKDPALAGRQRLGADGLVRRHVEHAWCGLAAGPSEMAFAHRQHPFNFLVLSSWAEPSEAERNIKWTRSVGTP